MEVGGDVILQKKALMFSNFILVTPKNSTAHLGRTSLGTSNYTTHISKFLNSAHSISGAFGNLT